MRANNQTTSSSSAAPNSPSSQTNTTFAWKTSRGRGVIVAVGGGGLLGGERAGREAAAKVRVGRMRIGRHGDDALVQMGRVMERAAVEIGIERVREGVDAARAVAAEFELEATGGEKRS